MAKHSGGSNKSPELADMTCTAVMNFMGRMADVLEVIRARPYWTDTSDGKKVQSELSDLGYRVTTFIEDMNTRVIPAINKVIKITERNSKNIALAYQPETIEQEVRVMAAIEARIDKVLARLTALKEYKRIWVTQGRASHLIESPSVVPAKARK